MVRLRFLLVGCALFAACGNPGQRKTWELHGDTMGTTYSVTIVTGVDDRPTDDLKDGIRATLDEVETGMSTYLIRSEVSRFNTSSSTDWFDVSPMICEAVKDSLEISELTDGAFDITVGPVVNLWGFGPEGQRREPPDEAMIAAAKARVGYHRVSADCDRPAIRKSRADVYVDLSAYAKGFAVDRVVDLLEDAGMTDYLVEVGGELRMSGTNGHDEGWRVAIELPADTKRSVRRVVDLTDAAMATSGDYRNFFEFGSHRYSHTIDPRKGVPVSHDLAAVTVVSDRAALADALATALLVLGPRDGMGFARRHDLAVYFQRRTDSGFTESMSPAFRRLAGDATP